MAYYGLRKPYVGLRKSTGVYETPIQFGKAIQFGLTVTKASGDLYADDELDDHDEEFVSCAITLGTNEIPTAAAELLFGHKTDSDSGEEVSNKDDAENYVGLGIIRVKKTSGTKKFEGLFLPKCKFGEPDITVDTKTESITYQTPSISGYAYADDNGDWRYTKEFDKQEDAITWITGKFTTASK